MALRQGAALLSQPALLPVVGNALKRCFASSTSEKFTVEVRCLLLAITCGTPGTAAVGTLPTPVL
jgi:hypothetical protein